MLKTVLLIVGVGFATNVIWENAQAPLYHGYSNFWQHLSICSLSTLGDVLIIFILYAFVVIIRRDKYWVSNIRTSDVLTLFVLGGLVAIGIERWALATDRWEYTTMMPLIPMLQVGLLPVLQMIILPICTFYVVARPSRD